MNRSICGDFEDEFLVVGFLSHTIVLYCELDVADWSIDGVNRNFVDFLAELAVLDKLPNLDLTLQIH